MRLSARSARVLLTCGHCVATGVAATGASELPQVALVLIAASFALAFGQLLTGSDLLHDKRNAIHATAHFLGGMMQSRVVSARLTGRYMWNVILVAHLPATLCSCVALLQSRRHIKQP